MSFDFFNTSYLAFGQKLYSAFATLDDLAAGAKLNIAQVLDYQSIFEDYINKNYQVPIPQSPTAPCRTDLFFDIINDKPIYINKINVSSNKIALDLTLVNRTNNRITRLKGETTLKEGYCYYEAEAISNTNPDRELKFTSNESELVGTQLFKFRIDKNNILNLVGGVSEMYIKPNDLTAYSSMSWGDKVAGANQDYTAQDYECLCIKGHYRDIQVKLNGTILMQGQGNYVLRHCIIYVKKGDVISGKYEYINRINYNL